MVTTTQIPPPRMQVVDPNTGMITREWYLWFVNLYNLTGSGSNPISLEDLQIGPSDTAYLEAIAASTMDVPENLSGYAEIDAKVDNLAASVLSAPPTLGGSVTSVDASGGTTGFSFSGGPITSMGTLTLSGTLIVSNGGTGATTLTGYIKGNGTSPFTASPTIPAADVVGVALTKTDDTNVTLTLGGSPTTALVAATSLTLGWTGTLAIARGGTGGGSASGTLLDNISGFASTGHLVRTGAGAYSFRTVTGTANQIDVSNGSGVSGNPTLSISAAYVGQTSITTLGTITAGTWQGTAIAVGYGGTGTATTFTDGSIVFAGASGVYGQDNATLNWDRTNKTLGVGRVAAGNVRVYSKGGSTGSGAFTYYGEDSAAVALFGIRDDGAFYGGLSTNSPYNLTTATAANAVFASDGYFYRSTSSIRYKREVRDYDRGLEAVKSLRPVFYKGKNDGEKQFVGLIAEEVDEAGLTEFVAYDEHGRPDALHYPNMVALLIKSVQDLSAQVDHLSAIIKDTAK